MEGTVLPQRKRKPEENWAKVKDLLQKISSRAVIESEGEPIVDLDSPGLGRNI